MTVIKNDYQFVKGTSELCDFSHVLANTLEAICKQVEESFSRLIKGDKNGKESGCPRFKNQSRFRTLYLLGMSSSQLNLFE